LKDACIVVHEQAVSAGALWPTGFVIRDVHQQSITLMSLLMLLAYSRRELPGACVRREAFLTTNVWTDLRFEQQRFYNPHHHPEMPRTLQSPDPGVGYGEDSSRMHYDQAVVCP
jgi:hypothetical protein